MSTINVIVKNGDRMMTRASAVEEGIEITFADGRQGVIPFGDLPEIGELANLGNIEIPNPYEVIVYDLEGQSAEIPWDFARHYCELSYRPRVEKAAAEGRRALGAQVRQLREAAGLTQAKLAEATGITRGTLLRIENGEQSPRYENILALARALGVPPERLVMPQ